MLSLLALVSIASAAPLELAHSGRLLDHLGQPVQGETTLQLSLYAAQNSPTAEWTTSVTVDVQDGYYAVTLGTAPQPPLELDDFASGQLWLGIQIDASDELDRTRILSTPFAVQAAEATVARSVDGTSVVATGPVIRHVQRRSLYAVDSTTNGRLPTRDMSFTKSRDDTSILFEWYDNFRCSGDAGESCRWDVRFRPASSPSGSGARCATPGPIRMDYYTASNNNIHAGSTVRGVCSVLEGGVPLTAGSWVIEIHEKGVPQHNHGSPYLGWGNAAESAVLGTMTLMTVEEIY